VLEAIILNPDPIPAKNALSMDNFQSPKYSKVWNETFGLAFYTSMGKNLDLY
jgi:hypothetical protein